MSKKKKSEEMDALQKELEALNVPSKPFGVKILEIPLHDIVIHVGRITELLRKANDLPVVIISINGRRRTGKSFMLNQCLKYLRFGYHDKNLDWINEKLDQPFGYGGGMERITSGIEVTSEPTIVKVNEQETAIYLMDTQGLFDEKTCMGNNILIFTFSLLLSSVTIFNDRIHSEDILQFLQLFLEHAKITGSENKIQDRNFSFQRLIFLLRDWPHEEEFKWGYYDDRNCPQGQTSNLKDEFLSIKDSTLSLEAVKTRKGITSAFQEISIFALPSPNCSYKNLDADLASKWDSDFRNYTREFVMTILSQDTISKSVKTIYNINQTGRSLVSYVEAWAEIIMSPKGLPAFSTLLEATIKMQYENCTTQAIEIYESDLERFISQYPNGVSSELFCLEHKRVLEKCVAVIRQSIAIGGEETKTRFIAELISKLNKTKERFKQINYLNSGVEQQRQEQKQQYELKEILHLQDKQQASIAENEQIRKRNARLLAIKIADNSLDSVNASLYLANQNLQLVYGMKASYTRMESVFVKRRTRLLGINTSPSYHEEKRIVFDQKKYDDDLKQALNKVNVLKEKVKMAEAHLNNLRMESFDVQKTID